MRENSLKVIEAKQASQYLLLSNADFIYELIDRYCEYAEKNPPIAGHVNIVYFFQLLLAADNSPRGIEDLRVKLALIDNKPKSRFFLHSYKNFAADLSELKRLIIPELLEENSQKPKPLPDRQIIEDFHRSFVSFSAQATALVLSRDWVAFAEQNLVRIELQNLAINRQEAQYTQRLEAKGNFQQTRSFTELLRNRFTQAIGLN